MKVIAGQVQTIHILVLLNVKLKCLHLHSHFDQFFENVVERRLKNCTRISLQWKKDP